MVLLRNNLESKIEAIKRKLLSKKIKNKKKSVCDMAEMEMNCDKACFRALESVQVCHDLVGYHHTVYHEPAAAMLSIGFCIESGSLMFQWKKAYVHALL